MELVDVEAGADDQITQPGGPLRVAVAAIHLEGDRTADRHVPVQVRERHRKLLVDRDRVRFHARIIASREH
jgi:hypothetical protein